MQFGIVVNDRRLAAKLEEFPAQLRGLLFDRIAVITEQLKALVEGGEPTKTGKLRGETTSSVSERKGRVTGRVFIARGLAPSEYGKAAALEYGAHGTASVKAHQQRLDHVFNKSISPESVMVAAYQRPVNITERRFFRNALSAVAAQFEAAVREAVDTAVAQ